MRSNWGRIELPWCTRTNSTTTPGGMVPRLTASLSSVTLRWQSFVSVPVRGRSAISALELEESQRHFSEYWTTIGRSSATGRVVELPGMRIVDSGLPWAVANAAVLTEPVASAADLQSRAAAAMDQFRAGGNPWFITGSQEWLGPDADRVLTSLG